MGILKSKSAEGERAPEFLDAECLGEKCPNFQGEPCADTKMEWMTADATVTEGGDTTQPPLVSEAKYVIYGQRCLAGSVKGPVAQRVEVYRPDEVDSMELIALTDRYGDMPVSIVTHPNAEQPSL